MDKSAAAAAAAAGESDPLRNLNKLSHKISKPNHRNNKQQPQLDSDPPPPLHPSPDHHQHQLQQQQQQPPVYNINKNDFREVVQKLTGSTSHPTPPPKPSSRLHRIRPPPLAPQNLVYRPQPPMSPLPPFPSVHPAAESPISAYLRFFQSSTTGMPPSPLAFACFSPSGGFAQPFPASPVPSPGNSAN